MIDLENKIETHIYRVIQEAMNNTKKHANTSKITVVLNQSDDMLTVDISDEGKGFDVARIDVYDKHGLSNMRQRIKMIKGTMHIDSRQGTSIKIKIPL